MKNYSKGFTILEVLVCFLVLNLGIAAVLPLIQNALSFSSTASQKLTAAYLTQEGIEIVRNIRDTNFVKENAPSWKDGLTECSAGCRADYTSVSLSSADLNEKLKIDNGYYKYSTTGTETPYKRIIKITEIAGGETYLKVEVEVSWNQGGKDYTVKAQENLYNWQ